MKNILLVDDHPAIWKYAALLIEEKFSGVTCHTASGEEEAMNLFRQYKMDCVILDLELKQGDGFELIRRIRERDQRTPILVNSRHEKAATVKRTLHLGANGYISKTDDPGLLIEAIRAVTEKKVNPFLSDLIRQTLIQDIATPDPDSPDVDRLLSKRELEVFKMLGRGMSRGEIADALFVSPSTVETHVDRMRKKLNLDSGKRLEFLAYQYVSERGEGK